MHWCWGGDGRAVPAAERNSPCKGPEAGEQCGTQGRVSRKVPSQPVSPSSPSLCSLRRPGKSRHPTKGSSDVFLIIIFSLWRSLKTCACTCSLSQGTWAGLGVGAGKDAPSHSHAAQGPGRPPPGPLGDGPGPQQPAWQQAKCLGRALALGPQCLAWARLSQRSSECVCQEGREPSGLVIYKPGTGAGPRAWGHCSLCVS